MENTVRNFNDVENGDIAVGNDCFDFLGPIVWSGTFREGIQEGWIDTYDIDEYSEQFDKKEMYDLEMVVVKFETYGDTLMMYDFDPCSAVVMI